MTLSAEQFVAVIVPTIVCSIAIGCILYKKCVRSPSIYKASSHRTAPREPTKCFDVESHAESNGPSPRSQTLLRQLETLVGRVVENKLEQVMCGKYESEDTRIQIITEGDDKGKRNDDVVNNEIACVTQTRSWPSQTEQLDCLAPIPTKWLTPSSPQARKDPTPPASGPPPPDKVAECARGTADALKQRLRARESQVQNLSSQLKDARQKLWDCMKENHAERTYLCQKSHDFGNGDVVTLLQYEKKMLGEKLNKETMRASKWAMIAKQQRLFLLQNETIGNEPDALQKHAAGIVFTAPPPSSDDDYGYIWDVSNGAGANPYVVDSWPMEPNSLAQRCPKNVPFGECVMEDSGESDDSSSERGAGGIIMPRADGEGGSLAPWSSRSDRSVRSAQSF